MQNLSEKWGRVYVNGNLISAEEACVQAFDRGFLYGDGVYETIRVYNGKPFMIDAHLTRLSHGCRTIGMVIPDLKEIDRGARALLAENGLSDAYLRITVTRGPTGNLWYELSSDGPTVMMMTCPFGQKDFGDGLKLIVSSFRSDERSHLCGVKQIGILQKIMARDEAVRRGGDDGLLLNTRGHVSEATASNIFWIRDNEVFTPLLTCGILDGITRALVIDLAGQYGITIHQDEYALDDLYRADEAFLTSSTWEIAPVRTIGDVTFAEAPGPVTKRLCSLYRRLVSETSG